MAQIYNHAAAERYKFWTTKIAAHDSLPADWIPHIFKQAERAGFEAFYAERGYSCLGNKPRMQEQRTSEAARGVWAGWVDRYGGAINAQLTDSGIKELAQQYAQEAAGAKQCVEAAGRELGYIGEGYNAGWIAYARALDFCAARGVDAPCRKLPLRGILLRLLCRYWWRRALRRMVARMSEAGYIELGMVCKSAKQAYASNKAVFRRLDQCKRNALAMQNTAMENEESTRATLADLAERSCANKSIRRGELMARIRGCEETADAMGCVGVFLTLTCPSRYHSIKYNGRKNRNYTGDTPRDAQAWLCLQWSRARAKLAREGVRVFGFRVAEPHHDGCPHWHMLLWAKSEADVQVLDVVVKERWLQDSGSEGGADKYRFNSKRLIKGGATEYIAKYISKNIDDEGVESHIDDYVPDGVVGYGSELVAGVEIKLSQRVEAWATTWGIRQFQALGQPPVTVWRELRKVAESRARLAGYGGVIHRAWCAVQGNPAGSKIKTYKMHSTEPVVVPRASWSKYVTAQGGMMRGRKNIITLAKEVRPVAGRYGDTERACVIGVRINTAGSVCTYSERRLWRVVDSGRGARAWADAGESALGAGTRPRTRVNNCTHNKKRSNQVIAGNAALRKDAMTQQIIFGADAAYYRALELLRRHDRDRGRDHGRDG